MDFIAMYEGRWWTARTAWCFFTNKQYKPSRLSGKASKYLVPLDDYHYNFYSLALVHGAFYPCLSHTHPPTHTHTHTHTHTRGPVVRLIRLRSQFPATDQCSGGAIRIKGLTAGHTFHSPVPHIYKTRPSEIFILYTEGSISHSDSFSRSLSH